MFCKYCGKNSGEKDICGECQQKISNYMSGNVNQGNNMPVQNTQPTANGYYNTNANIPQGYVPYQGQTPYQAPYGQAPNQGYYQVPYQYNQALAKPYKADAALGFRTGTTWKMVIATLYYLYMLYCIIHMYQVGDGWIDALYMLLGFSLPVDIVNMATNREKGVNKWVKSGDSFMKFLCTIGYAIAAFVVVAIIVSVAQYFAYGYVEI